MAKRGRPAKLTPEIQEEICRVIRAGNYIETAAVYAGIEKKTLYNWMKRGREELERLKNNPKARMRKSEAPYVEFLHAVKKALAEAEVRDVAIIGKAAQECWQAAAWRLERRFPERWGRRLDVKQEVQGQVKIEHDIVRKIVEDPEASELAFKLFERVVQNESGGDGLLPDEREMGTS